MFRFSQNGTPESLSDFLKGIAFERKFPVNGNIQDYVSYIKEGFRQLLPPQCFVDSFTIKKDVKTSYCLFFFTSHIRGAEKMLEAKWILNKEFADGWSYEDSTLSLFSKPQTHALEQKLLDNLAKNPMTNAQIYEMTIRSGFLPKHSAEILCVLQKNGTIVVVQANTPKRAFYLNYECHSGGDLSKRKSIIIKPA